VIIFERNEMSIYVHENECSLDDNGVQKSTQLVGPGHGAVNGYSVGVAYYYQDQYGDPGIHEDQEGFYVVAGEGMARVGDDEFPVSPGSAFIAAKGVPHAIKRNPDSEPVKVIWSHGAVS
jgi:mannose-6-phosphate isomerase-like protein (cupin superfamily)